MKQEQLYSLRGPEEPTRATIKVVDPIGYLRHEATHTSLNVYSPISAFHKTMLRLCFGLRYVGPTRKSGKWKRQLLFLATCLVLVALGTVVVLTKEQHPTIALLTVVAMGALCWAWQIYEHKNREKTKKL